MRHQPRSNTRCRRQQQHLRQRRILTTSSLSILMHVAVAFQANCNNDPPHNQRKSLPSSLTRRSMAFVTPSLSSVFNPETELWLDLRSTAIHPKAAMDHLETQLGTDTFVNRILLSESTFQDLIDYSDMYLATASQILYHDTSDDSIFFSTGGSRGLSVPFGTFQSPPSSLDSNNNDPSVVVKDPIPAMEVIASGKWLLLGHNNNRSDGDEDRETMRMNAVGTFLDIATTAVVYSSLADDKTGLLLPTAAKSGGNASTTTTTRSESEGEADGFVRGGVAVSCSSKSAVMKLASVLRLTCPGAMTSMTDSGIIVQSTTQAVSNVATAAVLPFEVDLWQVALLVFGAQGLAEIEQ